MAKFHFSLEQVLIERTKVQKLAHKDVVEKMSELYEAREHFRLLHVQIDQSRALSFERERLGGAGFAVSTQVYEFQLGQRKIIAHQESKIRSLETEVEKLQNILREKKLETTMIEKLREKKLQEFKQLERKREAKELDDMVTVRSAKQ